MHFLVDDSTGERIGTTTAWSVGSCDSFHTNTSSERERRMAHCVSATRRRFGAENIGVVHYVGILPEYADAMPQLLLSLQ
eukprot:SAG31_NODE_7367_length_1708_cov_5.615911_3_plen_80_part_00